MDFSLTSVFVIPKDLPLATVNGTQNLAEGEVGVFLNDAARTIALAADVNKSFFVAQGRTADEETDKTKKSDFIEAKRLKEYYKVPAKTTSAQQVSNIRDWKVKCGDNLSLTLRAQSRLINTTYYNGLTETFNVLAPCCDCGADPCADVTVEDITALVTEFAAKINASRFNEYVVATVTGVNSDVLTLTGKPIVNATTKSNNPYATNYEVDVVTFGAWAYYGAPTTMDSILDGRCRILATTTVATEPTTVRGTSGEVKTIERQHYAYQTPGFKSIFPDADLNPYFTTHVTDGQYYDEYVVEFYSPRNPFTFDMAITTDARIRIFAVAGSAESTAIDTLLKGLLGVTGNFDEEQE